MLSQRTVLSPTQLDTFIQRFGNQQIRVRQDLYNLLQCTPTLIPTQDTFVTNDGTSQLMLLLDGTIPISFRNLVYHIPVNIWIADEYPMEPPVCFVVPTKDMIIKNNHQHVDPTGLCYLPYLSQWRSELSNLVALVFSMGTIFSNDPPVYSRPPDYIPQTPIGPNPHMYIPHPPNTSPINIQTVLIPPKSPQNIIQNPSPKTTSVLATPPTATSPNGNGKNGIHRVSIADKRKMIEEKLFIDIAKLYGQTKDDLDRFSRTQSQLETNQQVIQLALDTMASDMIRIDENTDILERKDKEAEEWLLKYEDLKLNIDDLATPDDSLSQQLLELVVEDAAIDDTLYFLTRALEGDSLDLENYLKVYRNLSREQFMKRATCKKVFEAQHSLNGQSILRTSW